MKQINTNIRYYSNCTVLTENEVSSILQKSKKASYKRLVNKIKKTYPDIYKELDLNLYNPYHENTAQTNKYYILVHSAVEYFFEKVA